MPSLHGHPALLRTRCLRTGRCGLFLLLLVGLLQRIQDTATTGRRGNRLRATAGTHDLAEVAGSQRISSDPNAFQFFRMGYASAMGWILFLLILAVTAVLLRSARRWVHYRG